MIDITSKSPQAALARRLLKGECKRIMKKLQVSPKEALEILLDSMEQSNSEYANQVWMLREEIERIVK